MWSGRLVPEKAPHEAIDAVRRTGRAITVAGPVLDRRYFDREIRPRLGDQVRYAGHLDQRRLCDLVGSSAVAVVTPQWDEPYGLVAAEAMACGTPVAAYARGGLTEIVTPELGPAGDALRTWRPWPGRSMLPPPATGARSAGTRYRPTDWRGWSTSTRRCSARTVARAEA